MFPVQPLAAVPPAEIKLPVAYRKAGLSGDVYRLSTPQLEVLPKTRQLVVKPEVGSVIEAVEGAARADQAPEDPVASDESSVHCTTGPYPVKIDSPHELPRGVVPPNTIEGRKVVADTMTAMELA